MPSAYEHIVSMSTPREQGAVVYVVSRSGKVLGSEERSRRIVKRDYFEGELEGWIFWGSSKGKTSSYDRDRRQEEEFLGGSGSKGFIGNAFDGMGRRVSWTTRIPFVVWGDETDSFGDFFPPLHWTQRRLLGKKSTAKWRHGEGWENANVVFESSLVGHVKPHDLFPSERWYRMEQCYKIGLAQVAILQKLDIGSRWEPGTRELAARWAAWLLKMLRKTRSRPLQHLLFTTLSAVLPVICCSLVREQWNMVPDQELCRSVEIVWKALEKSYECFTSAQWEILEERLNECRKMQTKLESSTGRFFEGGMAMEGVEGSFFREQLENGNPEPPWKESQDFFQASPINSKDEQLSNMLLETEGASALVKRAVREKLSSQQARRVDGNGSSHGFPGSSGRVVSLECPISGKRIKVPARGKDCRHLSSFDLQSFLEEHVKGDRQNSNVVHRKKKPKTKSGAWCCPICGADATWPQLEVDGVLSRILEVLPDHMPQVCLLPNGRWRMIWSQVGLDFGKNDTKLTAVGIQLPFTSIFKDSYGLGQGGECRPHSCKAGDHGVDHDHQQSCGCREVQTLHRAYKTWKGGVEHPLSRGDASGSQSNAQWGPKSTIALWTGGDSSWDPFWQPVSPQRLVDNKYPATTRVSGEINGGSVNDIDLDSGIAVGDIVEQTAEVEASISQKIAEATISQNAVEASISQKIAEASISPKISEPSVTQKIAEGSNSQKIAEDPISQMKVKEGVKQSEISSRSKTMLNGPQAPKEVASGCERGQLRLRQHKSRPKVMARRT